MKLKAYNGENESSLIDMGADRKPKTSRKPKRIRRSQSSQLNYDEPIFYNHVLALSPRYSIAAYNRRVIVRKLVKLVGCLVFSAIISTTNLNDSGLLSGMFIGSIVEFILSFGFSNALESAAIKGQFGVGVSLLTLLFKAETFFGVLLFYLTGTDLMALFLTIMVSYVGGHFVQFCLAHEFGLLDMEAYSKLNPEIFELLYN